MNCWPSDRPYFSIGDKQTTTSHFQSTVLSGHVLQRERGSITKQQFDLATSFRYNFLRFLFLPHSNETDDKEWKVRVQGGDLFRP